MLRPLLDIAHDLDRFRALAAEVAKAGRTEAHVSASLRPYLLAALLEAEEGLEGRPALLVTADDRSARDLARDLGAFLAPRTVRFYPSRGTGYESHVAPPPHLVGLRIAALDALTGGGGGGGGGPLGDASSAEAKALEGGGGGGEAGGAGKSAAEREPPVVVASAIALAEAVPDANLRPAGFALHRGEEVDLGDVAELLVECGYERIDQVEERGQFALRGGILDVYPATEERAVRVELFGDEIESLRWFSTFTQRSLGDAERVEIAPAAELAAEYRELAEAALGEGRGEAPGEAGQEGREAGEGSGDAGRSSFDIADVLPVERFQAPLDLVPGDAAVIVAQADEIAGALDDHWDDVTTAMHDKGGSAPLAGPSGAASPHRHLYVEVSGPLAERAALEVSGQHRDQSHSFRAQRPASVARTPAEAEAELSKQLRSGYATVVAFERRGEAERARYSLDRLTATMLDESWRPHRDDQPDGAVAAGEPSAGQLLFAGAPLTEGFISPELKLAVLPWRQVLHRRRAAAPAPSRTQLRAFSELRVGDHVVHEDHGIARFAGFETKTLAGVTRDYLQLEYRGEDRVFVPADQLAKISRYIGAGGEAPQLSALGGSRWEQMKARAKRAAGELAGELLNLYAERRARPGYAFSADGEFAIRLRESFPYRETADQLDAIEAVEGDMEAATPMDRLICGDVGYGKTEVAMRAAMKAVADSKQVMMLVPTTILAQQHLGTFRERLADLPVTVDMVSRLRRPAEVRATLKEFAEGRLDVLIGTHRLLSRDVRARDLGLLIVDEEQRFGVKQKELLRQLKLKVDVISLSATPIPRTLQMSMAGLRDISVIETPPEGRRPVRTYVGPFDDELVRRAIERELAREGQVFFLHNRIETLHEIAEGIRALVPKARVVEAHGRMGETELEATMLAFLRGDADVLVATTIIESGLDIPTANTLIVERADQLGLAQAYQIRGRVGRSRERAYAYLLYPAEETLSADAGARLATLSDHTELGSGFAIAMRDLELRGAGDLLGDEQSGHVAAVGFELYVRMLEQAVESLRAEGEREAPEAAVRLDLDVDAYVPAEYVPFEAAKIDVHRRVSAAREPGELRELAGELRDRFGPLPEPLESLVALQRARIELGRAGASSVEVRGGRLTVTPLELDSEQSEAVTERVEGAIYEWRERSLSLRVPDDPAARLESAVALAEAVAALRAGEPVAA